MNERIATRLYVEEPLSEGAVIGLDHARAHFLRSVLRLERGATLAVFNAREGEWLAEIEGLGKGWCSLRLGSRRRAPEPEPDLWLVFAPIKRARIDFIAEKATELGCSRLLPVLTRFTDVARVNVERLAANAREAAEQCGRLSVPEVAEVRALDALLAEWPEQRCLLVADESGERPPAAAAIREALDAGARSWAALVGPEGGFAENERALLHRHPATLRVGLGPRILRADTAAVAALTLLQAFAGDWR
jgi:16S rRNA (uracil1498-N3)-methyltransferase